jgi:hypothetical protein
MEWSRERLRSMLLTGPDLDLTTFRSRVVTETDVPAKPARFPKLIAVAGSGRSKHCAK